MLGGRVNFSEGTEIPFVEPEAIKFTTDPNRVGPKGGYRVSIIRGGKSFDKTFSVSAYGSKNAALAAATEAKDKFILENPLRPENYDIDKKIKLDSKLQKDIKKNFPKANLNFKAYNYGVSKRTNPQLHAKILRFTQNYGAGQFPIGDTAKERLFYNLYRSTTKDGSRWQEFSPKPKNYLKDGQWRKTVFVDTKTNEKINFNNLDKYLDKNFGKGTYNKAIKPIEDYLELKKLNIKYKGKSTPLFTAIKDRYIERETIKNFGLKYKPENKTTIINRSKIWTPFNLNHQFGVKDNWWTTELTTSSANRELNNKIANLKTAKDLNSRKKIIGEIKKIQGRTLIDNELVGKNPKPLKVIEEAFEERGLKKTFQSQKKKITDFLKKNNITFFTALERGNPARKKLEALLPRPAEAAVFTPFDFFMSLAGGSTLPEASAIAATNVLPKTVQKALPSVFAAYDTQKEVTDKFEPVFNLSGGEETKFGKKIREGVGEAIDKIKDRFGGDAIGTADEVPESESAERRKMFEDFNERFGDTNKLEISDIDNPFMAAMGGRVGFANGSPNPIEEMATLKQAIASTTGSTELKDQFLYDTSPIGKLDKNIFGKDGDRNLMQQFNTQFLDPRSYPYYAQKFARGAANIPELAFRFPFAVTGVARDFITGEEGKLERFGETLDPKFTRNVLDGGIGDLLGISSAALEAAEEKRTNPQKVTGEFLQFGAEVFGPATPYFLIKKFPKLFKQLRDLGASGTAVDKINKEIENKVAQQGVDQTRRDIVLSIGAGGAVAFLKYLGLDFLAKAPKAAKVTEEIVTKGGTPKYFFDFVNLIKTKGDDITEKAATLERQKVYNYNGYELTEDISTGKINIRKDTEGGGSYPIGDGEYETVEGIVRQEEINYNPSETIINDKGKSVRVPDNYSEDTARVGYDGEMDDVSVGLDSIDEILQLLSKDGKKYTLNELQEMGINLEGIGDDVLLKILKDPTELKIDKIRTKGDKAMDEIRERITGRSDKAGGGIMKMAGDDSGPPPKSGPTPHGLPYVAKNVRPIKERK
jgi:ElaB/YqjD/DUF883 family membrane-anchored ribosome-binding protein